MNTVVYYYYYIFIHLVIVNMTNLLMFIKNCDFITRRDVLKHKNIINRIVSCNSKILLKNIKLDFIVDVYFTLVHIKAQLSKLCSHRSRNIVIKHL